MKAPYVELIAGTEALVSTMGIFNAGQGVIPALTPLMLEPTKGSLVVWDGVNAGQAVYVSAFSVDTSVQTNAQVYKCGVLNVDALQWPESVTTLTAKLGAFAGSGISVQPLSNM